MITLDITLSEEEYFQFTYYSAWQASWNKKKRVTYYLKTMISSIVIGSAFLYLLRNKYNSSSIAVGLVVLLLFYFIILPIWIKSDYKRAVNKFIADSKNANVFLPTTLEIGETGIREKTAISETNYAWSAFVKKVNNKGTIYLYLNNQLAILIPERTFRDPKEKEQTLKILSEHLPLEAEFSSVLS